MFAIRYAACPFFLLVLTTLALIAEKNKGRVPFVTSAHIQCATLYITTVLLFVLERLHVGPMVAVVYRESFISDWVIGAQYLMAELVFYSIVMIRVQWSWIFTIWVTCLYILRDTEKKGNSGPGPRIHPVGDLVQPFCLLLSGMTLWRSRCTIESMLRKDFAMNLSLSREKSVYRRLLDVTTHCTAYMKSGSDRLIGSAEFLEMFGSARECTFADLAASSSDADVLETFVRNLREAAVAAPAKLPVSLRAGQEALRCNVCGLKASDEAGVLIFGFQLIDRGFTYSNDPAIDALVPDEAIQQLPLRKAHITIQLPVHGESSKSSSPQTDRPKGEYWLARQQARLQRQPDIVLGKSSDL
jgi:hypothetical protein